MILTRTKSTVFSLKAPTHPKNAIVNRIMPTTTIIIAGSKVMFVNDLIFPTAFFSCIAQVPPAIRAPPKSYLEYM